MDLRKKAEQKFFEGHTSVEALVAAASEVCQRGGQVYGSVFSASSSAKELATYLGREEARERGFKVNKGSPFLIQLSRSDNKAEAKAFLWDDKERSTVYLLTSQAKAKFDLISSKIHLYLRPQVCRVFLRTREIHDGLSKLTRENPAVSIRVREYVSRSLIDDTYSIKKVRTKREWTDEDYATVFEKLSEQRYWLSSLKIEIRSSGNATGRIWRDASFSCTEGFDLFFRTLLSSISSAVGKSSSFFDKRDVEKSPTNKPRPLKITYGEEVFRDKKQNLRFMNVLNRLSDSALSVLHPNPYFHGSLIDYADGSTYDIWVATTSSILIVPKIRATTESMERLCNQICDKFEEGEVTDFTNA